MGSDFSDPILIFILTYFCYRINGSKYRMIDKEYIIEYFEKNIILNIEYMNKLFNLFEDRPITYIKYTENKQYYLSKIKDIIILEEEDIYNIISSILSKELISSHKIESI